MEPHEVPTHLDAEPRILFGLLTARQAVVAALGVALGLALATRLPDGVPPPVRLGLVAAGLATGLAWAFLRPLDRPLERWLPILLRHYTAPRRYLWRGGEEPEQWEAAPAAARIRVVLPGEPRGRAGGAPNGPGHSPWTAADLPPRRSLAGAGGGPALDGTGRERRAREPAAAGR
ncbi:MAG TPA: PrgI family protein [Dehalococcoidia bacterium]